MPVHRLPGSVISDNRTRAFFMAIVVMSLVFTWYFRSTNDAFGETAADQPQGRGNAQAGGRSIEGSQVKQLILPSTWRPSFR
jgi:hypothetical protein